tara:strand:+ start:774 stop:1013 length:240 start_codon:yes stop_codon:yes gene_type:complete
MDYLILNSAFSSPSHPFSAQLFHARYDVPLLEMIHTYLNFSVILNALMYIVLCIGKEKVVVNEAVKRKRINARQQGKHK